MQAIHQFVAGFRQGDAISGEARALRAVFRAWGHAAEIVCEPLRTAPQVRHEVQTPEHIGPSLRPDDVALLHLSIGTPINRFFRSLRCRKVLLYHNITPASYFRLYNPALCADLAAGRQQVAELAGTADLNLADSAFNARELTELGFSDVRVLPLLIDLAEFSGDAHDAAVAQRLGHGLQNVLFVGRCVPNKRIEDLLVVLHYLQRGLAPRARLVHVGSQAGVEAYHTLLLAQARELGLRDTLFLGPVTQAGLNTCYRAADAFLCLSAHEGFCAPLLEAMLHGVPVLACDAGAIAETLDGAGVLFHQRDLHVIAEVTAAVLQNTELRHAIHARQEQRIARLRTRDVASELRELLKPLLT